MINIDEYKDRYPDIWTYTGEDHVAFLDALELQRLIDPGDVAEWKEKVLTSDVPAINDWRCRLWELSVRYPDDTEFIEYLAKTGFISKAESYRLLPALIPAEIVPEIGMLDAARMAVTKPGIDYAVAAAKDILDKRWEWIKKHGGDIIDLIWGHLKAAFEQYWPPVNEAIEKGGREVFDWAMKTLLHGGPVTPEDAPGLAVKMFGVALGAGITAHALSVGFELVHPFKELGFHQMTGMIAQLGSFGPVSAATLGQVHYAALRRPMSYAMNAVTRSQIPDDMVLQIMAVKPDIPMEKFVETMKYHGYSDYWIDRIKTTMFHEPRYFELKMMSEDEAATDEWLFEKSRRAGFNEADSRIMVSSYIKGAMRDQRKEYYKQGFNLFKEGYIQREHFNKIIDDLELRPGAVTLATRGAELAYLLDTISDETRYWTDSFLKDLISDDELELQLSLLGLNRWRVDLKVRQAKVRKYKKPGKPVQTELEKVMNQARSKYSQGYITLYRKELIDTDTLYAYLLEIGIADELAEATTFLEQARKMEKEVIA